MKTENNMTDQYEQAKQQLITEHIQREGTKELSEAEKYVLWFIDQEKKLAHERKITNPPDISLWLQSAQGWRRFTPE